MQKRKKPLTNFFFELGMLKKIEHCGVKFAGVKYPDSLAEHSLRAAQIGYLLALLEGADAEKTAVICIMHDIGEIRIGDTHRIAEKYMDTKPAEKKAVIDQTSDLPQNLRNPLRRMLEEFYEGKSREAVIAKDADLLETIIQAKEYLDMGYESANRWLENGSKYLKTKTAKKLFKEIRKTKFHEWWDALNKVRK